MEACQHLLADSSFWTVGGTVEEEAHDLFRLEGQFLHKGTALLFVNEEESMGIGLFGQ